MIKKYVLLLIISLSCIQQTNAMNGNTTFLENEINENLTSDFSRIQIKPQPIILSNNIDHTMSALFSPDGNRIAFTERNSVIKFLNAKTLEIITAMQLRATYPIKFSPRNDFIALIAGKHITLCNAHTYQCIAELPGHNYPILSIAISPKNMHMASRSIDDTIKLWDIEKNQSIVTSPCQCRGEANLLEYSFDGTYIASQRLKTIELWNANTLESTTKLKGHVGSIKSIAFSPNNCHMASASSDDTIKIWDLRKNQPFKTLEYSDEVNSVAFSSNGEYMISAEGTTIALWNAQTYDDDEECVKEFRGHTAPVKSVAFSPNGQYIISTSQDNTVRLWKTSSPTLP